MAPPAKVPSASPTGMFSLDTGTSPVWSAVAGTAATDNDRAAVGTVADNADGDIGTVKKRNFHTGLDPVSRTKNSAQPTEFNAAVVGTDKVRFAQLFSLDTGSSPVWSVVVGTAATGDNRAVVAGTVATVGDGVGNRAIATDTVTNPDDEIIVTTGKKVSSSYRQDAGIQTQGQQARAKHSRRRRTPVTTTAIVNCRPWIWIPASCGYDKP